MIELFLQTPHIEQFRSDLLEKGAKGAWYCLHELLPEKMRRFGYLLGILSFQIVMRIFDVVHLRLNLDQTLLHMLQNVQNAKVVVLFLSTAIQATSHHNSLQSMMKVKNT